MAPVVTELDRAERKVEDHSVALKKPLGLFDLVLTQIVFIVGSSWVGTAAKLGSSHLFFWLLAILLFYIPQAAVVIYLNRLMPLEGGIYQWAKFAFNEFTGFIVAWNLWLLSIMVIALGGMFVTTNLSYALGEEGAWMRNSPWCVSIISCLLVGGLGWTGVRGLSLGKWLHNIGGFAMLLAYAALIVLPFVMLARGDLSTYRPLQIAAPTVSIFYSFNIFTKLAVGALSGFEYVGILAGETRAPARNIGRSVIIAAPIIALMFILGTSSVLAYVSPDNVDSTGPIPQVLSIGFRSFGWVSKIVSLAILGVVARQVALMSIYFTGNARLPMVAGWDRLLPAWFTRLHAKYKTPVNSILVVGAVTLGFGLASLIGVGEQEAFQLLDNAAGVFYGTTYLVLFAIPIIAMTRFGARAPIWLKVASGSGFLVSLLYIILTVFPIIEVKSWLSFASKIIAVVIVANALGAGLYLLGRKRAI